ncbi:hypothetical protein LshimejAT787_1205360 [Lyophyllum shimeji]|uniref:Uncharacterized protein n=1 Tax=Lyophyllum shimeji TaxID=47721 RepID=A0A9P3PUE7_LYOSH|nr:hypothetical protein LshimejAT787_1205360 [Lyophyllum shimeji]
MAGPMHCSWLVEGLKLAINPGSNGPAAQKQYVVRATRTSGEFLADSPAFEILAGTHTTSGSSVSSTSSGASRSTASTVSSSSSNTSTPPGLGRAKQSPVGAIVGGVLGGLALIAIILGLLLCLRHRREGKSSTSGDLEKSRLETRNSRLEPFTAIQPQASSSASTSTKRPLASNSPVTALVSTAGDSTDFISMSSPLLSSALPPSSPPVSDSVSSRAAAQAELRQQKRQLKQQIALAENGSPVSSPSANGSSPRSDDADVRQQLDDLRAQIRQLELRQAQASAPAWQENTPEEPPPDYNR